MNNSISTNRLFSFFLIFAICFIVFAMRKPDVIVNPQFWAEDGTVWYQQAYTLGAIKSLILPQNGYYQSIGKLVASFSLIFPMYAAPLIYNIIAISIRCFMVMFLLSSRMERYPLIGRSILALFIVLMPHIDEVHANITNTHWYLSMWLFMIIIANDSKGLYWKAHDYIILIISGLSGPFIVFLAPVLALKKMEGESWRKPLQAIRTAISRIDLFTVIFVAICLVQIIAILLSTDEGRSHAPLSAGLIILAKILASKVFLGFLLPLELTKDVWHSKMLYIPGFLVGISLMAFCFFKGDWRVKSLVIFPTLMLGFALAKPMIHLSLPQWPMIELGSGQRYFVITNIFWVAIILTSIAYCKGMVKWALTSLLAVLIVISGYYNFTLHKLGDENWIKQVYIYQQLKPGEKTHIRVTPSPWAIIMDKK